MAEDNSTPEDNGESIEIEVPEIEFKRGDPLHRGAMALHMDRTDALNEAMLLLQESKNLLSVMLDLDPDTPVAVCETMAKDVHRRVRKALKALDKQEFADRDVYLALAETQRK
jgi:hypothetical protein